MGILRIRFIGDSVSSWWGLGGGTLKLEHDGRGQILLQNIPNYLKLSSAELSRAKEDAGMD